MIYIRVNKLCAFTVEIDHVTLQINNTFNVLPCFTLMFSTSWQFQFNHWKASYLRISMQIHQSMLPETWLILLGNHDFWIL